MKNRARARRVRCARSRCRRRRRRAACAPTSSSKRFDSDISAVCAALAITLDGATRARRARSPSAAWRRRRAARRRPRPRCAASRGARPTPQAAAAALARDFTPITDLRASAGYRQRVAAQPAAPLLARDAAAGAAAATQADRVRARDGRMNKPSRTLPASTPRRRSARDRAHESAHLHVAGEATYTDDMPRARAARCTPRSACRRWRMARLVAIDVERAARRAGRRRRCSPPPTSPASTTAARSSARRPDPRRTARVHYLGQPVFAVVADDRATSRAARPRAQASSSRSSRCRAVLTAREAPCRRSPTSCRRCTWRAAMRARRIAAAPHRLQGHAVASAARSSSTSRARSRYAVPLEDGGLLVHCSTQHPSEMQHVVAHALGLHAAPGAGASAGAWAAASAARSRSRRCSPAWPRSPRRKLRPPGQAAARTATTTSWSPASRHGFEFDYEVGFDDDGRILGVEVDADRQRRLLGRPVGAGDDARASATSTTPTGCRTWRCTATAARTNTQSNTAFRGFGGPQGAIAIECILDEHRARASARIRSTVRRANFYGIEPSATSRPTGRRSRTTSSSR
ncbi:MAG: molybdopterin-dependent oxidoreductase [Comamonadaceae bacterium]|nr:molybdopterin-dependent oxidoreductase [Comamonadaceae bacterium]